MGKQRLATGGTLMNFPLAPSLQETLRTSRASLLNLLDLAGARRALFFHRSCAMCWRRVFGGWLVPLRSREVLRVSGLRLCRACFQIITAECNAPRTEDAP